MFYIIIYVILKMLYQTGQPITLRKPPLCGIYQGGTWIQISDLITTSHRQSFRLCVRAWRKREAVQAKALAGLRKKALPNRKLPFSWVMTKRPENWKFESLNDSTMSWTRVASYEDARGLEHHSQPSLPDSPSHTHTHT